MKKKKKNDSDNRCWFDGETKCPFHEVMRGFIDADSRCGLCQYFDRERFISWYYPNVYHLSLEE